MEIIIENAITNKTSTQIDSNAVIPVFLSPVHEIIFIKNTFQIFFTQCAFLRISIMKMCEYKTSPHPVIILNVTKNPHVASEKD